MISTLRLGVVTQFLIGPGLLLESLWSESRRPCNGTFFIGSKFTQWTVISDAY